MELFDALAAGDTESVRALVARDPAIGRTVGPMGVGGIQHALYLGRADLAELLATDAAAPSFLERVALGRADALAGQPDLGARSPDGFTALHYAAFFGHLELARALLAAGADPNAVAANPSRVRPLHSALVRPVSELVAALLEGGAEVDAVQHGGITALHAAAMRGDASIVEQLLAAGADPALADEQGRTASDHASPDLPPGLLEPRT